MNTLTVRELKQALEFYNDDLEVVVPYLDEGSTMHEAPELMPTIVECACGHETKFLVLFPPSVY